MIEICAEPPIERARKILNYMANKARITEDPVAAAFSLKMIQGGAEVSRDNQPDLLAVSCCMLSNNV